jgi:hypothetical protein
MLTSIEEAIVARLAEKITVPKNVRIDEAHSELALHLPGIDVIVGGGSFAKIAQRYKLNCSVFVIVTFQNLKSVKDRRHGTYPILLAVLAYLVKQDFGLAIDGLVPKRLDNITEKDAAEAGKIVFQIEFETGFVVDPVNDETVGAEDLLEMGFKYYLKPGDDVADAEDVVKFGT